MMTNSGHHISDYLDNQGQLGHSPGQPGPARGWIRSHQHRQGQVDYHSH